MEGQNYQKKKERKEIHIVELKVKHKYTIINYKEVAVMEKLSFHFLGLWNCSQRYSLQIKLSILKVDSHSDDITRISQKC